MRRIVAYLSVAMAATPALAAERVVEIPSRGAAVRALEELPAAPPTASVILLAGGSGKLDISPGGEIGDLSGNQLVRTRHMYAAQGFAVLVPDLGPGVAQLQRFRASPEHAADLGALVEHMRGIARPVVIVGTSRGTLSAANALAHTEGARHPDAAVLTSGYFGLEGNGTIAAFADGKPAAFAVPMLLLGHEDDGCRGTAPAAIPAFRRWLGPADAKVEARVLSGGSAPGKNADPCGASSAHGFLGLDAEVVETVTQWIRALPRGS